MGSLIYLVLSIISVKLFTERNYKGFIISICLLIYNCFGVTPLLFNTNSRNIYNCIFLILVICCISSKNYLKKEFAGDKIGNVIKLILVYQFINVIASALYNVDSWINVIGQYRFCLSLLFYFVFLRIDVSIIVKLLHSLYRVLSIVIVLFIFLSLFGYTNSQTFLYLKYSIMGLAPSLCFFALFEANDSTLKYRKQYIAILFLGIVSLLARFYLIAFLSSIVIYLLLIQKKVKYIIPILVFVFSFPLIFSYVDKLKGEQSGSIDFMSELSSIKESNDYSDYATSSATLRFISVVERVEYMKERPFNLLFGVGAMKEATAQEKMSFISGTHGTLEGDDKVKVLQLDTDDVGLLSKFMRYGLFYIVLFLLFCYRAFQQCRDNINFPLMRTGLLLILFMLLAIPGCELFFYEWSLFPFYLLIAISTRTKYHL